MIKDRKITITINSDELFKRLSINEWNALITSYENDPNAEVEPYNEDKDGWCFIHTTLSNVVDNHSLSDLRFASWVSEDTEEIKNCSDCSWDTSGYCHGSSSRKGCVISNGKVIKINQD